MSKVILFIVNDAGFFISHRLAVAKGAQADGYVVHIACMPGPAVERFRMESFAFHSLPITAIAAPEPSNAHNTELDTSFAAQSTSKAIRKLMTTATPPPRGVGKECELRALGISIKLLESA